MINSRGINTESYAATFFYLSTDQDNETRVFYLYEWCEPQGYIEKIKFPRKERSASRNNFIATGHSFPNVVKYLQGRKIVEKN